MQVGPGVNAPPRRGKPGLRHLIAGAVEYVRSRRLAPAEQMEAARLLDSPAEAELFWGQPAADQRHGLTGARLIAREEPGRRDLMRAALLHDVGKRRAGLGLPGRTWAALADRRGWKKSRRADQYLNHGPAGAGELAAAGAGETVTAYARSHHGCRPPSIPPSDWRALLRADRPRWRPPPATGDEPSTAAGR